MVLSRRYWWSKDFRYIISLGIKKKINRILLSFIVVKLNDDILQNKVLLQSYYNNYLSDRNNVSFLDNISGITAVFDHDYRFEDINALIRGLTNLERQNRGNDTIILNFGNNIRVTLTYTDLVEMIDFVKSYYQNYNVIDAVMRLMLISSDRSDQNEKPTLKVGIGKVDKQGVSKPIDESNLSTSENDDAERQLQYVAAQLPFITKQFLVHMFLTYCININIDNPVTVNDDGKEITMINPFALFRSSHLVYGKFFTDKFVSIISSSIIEMDNEITGHLLKQVINYIIDAKTFNSLIPPLKIFIILQLILLALIKVCKNDENSYNYIMTNIDRILNNSDDILSRILNYATSSEVKFVITNNTDHHTAKSEIDKDLLDRIIKEYEHIKPIDEKKFVSLVLKKYDDESKNDGKKADMIIPLGETKIIDITRIGNNRDSTKSPVIKIINDSLDNTETFPLLSYSLNDQYITALYQDFVNFLNDETSILVKLNDDKVNPAYKAIYKTFPIIKTFIENHNICRSKLTSTLDLYHDIVRSNEFRDLLTSILTNQIILLIIFQIFIPYFYHKFGQKQFVDNLL